MLITCVTDATQIEGLVSGSHDFTEMLTASRRFKGSAAAQDKTVAIRNK
jgi:hypothetical protein